MKAHKQRGTILLVDDEEHILYASSLMLRADGFESVMTAGDPRQVMQILADEAVAVVVLDLCMPQMSGQELLKEIAYTYPELPVLVMTALDDLQTAVDCMKAGAFDYLVKPVEKERLLSSVRRAMERSALLEEISALKQRLLDGGPADMEAFSPIVTRNAKMFSLFQYLEAVAGTGHPVLITGETGTGKELFARALHRISGRKGEFVAVNAAGLDDTVLSDTLFGHRRGAYTSAEGEREGLVTRAAGGTLFLDEIGDLEPRSQQKLLRLLQEGDYYPLGSDRTKKSDARIVAATNRNLKELTAGGGFRNDLYYRLASHHLHIPPLRERRDDLPLLLEHFIAEATTELGRKPLSYSPELITLLASWHFPGNIRELQAMVHDAAARQKGGMLSLALFRDRMGDEKPLSSAAFTDCSSLLQSLEGAIPTLKEAEECLVSEALRRSGRNQGIAAAMLGITRQALNKRLNKKQAG